MRTAPAIILLVVGAALCGGMLELLGADAGRRTLEFEEILATLGGWLLNTFMALARIMKKR